MRTVLLIFVLLPCIVTQAQGAAWPKAYPVRDVRVIDGDTMELTVELGLDVSTRAKVRLKQIDTPETYGLKKGDPRRALGLAATAFTRQWVADSTALQIRAPAGRWRRGKYGRWLVQLCRSQGGCLADALRAAGHVKR